MSTLYLGDSITVSSEGLDLGGKDIFLHKEIDGSTLASNFADIHSSLEALPATITGVISEYVADKGYISTADISGEISKSEVLIRLADQLDALYHHIFRTNADAARAEWAAADALAATELARIAAEVADGHVDETVA